MHHEEWSASRVAAALAALADSGIPQSRVARMAGVNRSQVNRWSRGENRPGYDPVRRLAVAVWREHPRGARAARELVEASGYPWTEPGAAPDPPPIPADVLEVIGKYPPREQAKIIEELAKAREQGALDAEGQSPPGGGGTTRAG